MTGAAADDAVDFVAIASDSPPTVERRRQAILETPIAVVVSVGGARLTVRELMELGAERIIRLDRNVADPVELIVGEQVVARGELVDMEGEAGGIGVRLTEICDAGGGD